MSEREDEVCYPNEKEFTLVENAYKIWNEKIDPYKSQMVPRHIIDNFLQENGIV
jgi:hypothetical protein